MTNHHEGKIHEKTRRSVIRATGRAVPEKILTNFDLEKMVDTSDKWITTRTGIKERRIITEGETTASLSLEAARIALKTAKVQPADIELIICATITPEMIFPATACFIEAGLGIRDCCAFDLTAACSGFTYGLAVADAMIVSGLYRNALVFGSETLSTITNYADRTSCILFGDGAGAVLLEVEENSNRGILYSSLHADGVNWDTLCCTAYGSRNPCGRALENPDDIYMKIKGRETYQLAVRRIVELVEETYHLCGLGSDDIAMIIPHQMNARIIESVVKRLNIPSEKMFVNIDKYGNTSSASIALALDEAVRDNHLKQGDLIILVSFGAGLTWGVNLIRL